MSSGVFKHDQILTVGAGAWHGEDDNFKKLSLEQVRQERWNFTVKETPLTYIDPYMGEPVLSNQKVTYREVLDSKGQPMMIKLGEVGSGYTVVQNDQTLDLLKPIEESGLADIETAGTLFNGRKVWVLFKLTDYEPIPGDTYTGYLGFFNSHDGTMGACFMPTSIRLECNNTWRMAFSIDKSNKRSLSVRHSANVITNLEQVRDLIDLTRNQFLATSEQLKALADVVIESQAQVERIVKVAFSINKQIDEAMTVTEDSRKSRVFDDINYLLDRGRGMDVYGGKMHGLRLFNAITEYTNHVSGIDRKNPSSVDSRIDSVLFGQSAKIIDRSIEAILALK